MRAAIADGQPRRTASHGPCAACGCRDIDSRTAASRRERLIRRRQCERARRSGLIHSEGAAGNRDRARPRSRCSVRCDVQRDCSGSRSGRARRHRNPRVVAGGAPRASGCYRDSCSSCPTSARQRLTRRRNARRTRHAKRECVRARARGCASWSNRADHSFIRHAGSERAGEQRDEVDANHSIRVRSRLAEIGRLHRYGAAREEHIHCVTIDEGQAGDGIDRAVVRRWCEFDAACVAN